MSGYAFSVWLHLVAATAWVGSMIFFAVAVVPVLRRPELRESAPALLALVGPRFRVLGWISLALLVVTGIVNLHYRGVTWASLFEAPFWASSFGRALGYKLVLVLVVVLATAGHELVVKNRRAASLLGRFVMLASLAILFFAVAMVRGFLD